MGIFRGVGGVGDADTDAFASEVNEDALTAEQKANEAAASAAQAAASATQAASSASSASSDAAEAAASISTVISAKDAAEDARDTAIAAKDTAVSAQAATATSETNAAASAASSSSSATAAAASETSAAASATSATASANTATTKATEAATSATNALASANAAANSATEAATVVQGIQDDVTQSAANAAAAQAAAENAVDLEAQASLSAASANNSATAAAGSASTASTASTNATTKATEAAASASSALTSANNAANSETASAASEAAAAISAITATTQASNASTSASQAATSASNAANSESAAADSETAAATSETNAAASATSASASATSAASSATSSASSASSAALSAADALASETNAANSATAASSSASSAATSAATATTKATESANSATAALASETAAAESESAAAASETNASNSEAAASSSETAAASSAAAALASQTAAATSASDAATSASSATTSATSAASSATIATSAKDTAVAAQTSASSSATAAASSATSAASSALAADQSAQDAQDIVDGLGVVASVTAGDISNWDSAYAWGDHAAAGYADSTSVQSQIDAVVASLNTGNWDTAYSWGNHAAQGYTTETYVDTAVSNLVDSSPATLDTLNELAAALGDDPNFATTVSTQIGTKWTQDNTKISNWDTAYSWGNHASVGYLTSVPTPTVGNWFNGGFIRVGTDGVMEVGKYLDFHTSNTGTSDFDLRITADVNKLTIAGTLHTNEGNSAQWDTAYSWGNHASAGYLPSTSYTAADVLAKVKTVDGSGSGLDADLLDGQHASAFAPASHTHSYLPLTGKAADSDKLDGLDSTAYMRDDGWNTSPGQDANTQPTMKSDFSYSNNAPHTGDLIRFGGGGYSLQLSSAYSGGNALSFRTRNGDNNTWNPWRKVWHDGNDGSGSGLDADLLDGNHASAFALASHTHSNYLPNSGTVTHSGLISFTGTGSTSGIRFNSATVANDAFGIRVNGTSNAGELEFYSTDDDTEPFVFRHYTTGQDGTGSSVEWARINNDYLYHSSDIRTPIFYDSNNTAYYVDPASTSNLNALNVATLQSRPIGDYHRNVDSAQAYVGGGWMTVAVRSGSRGWGKVFVSDGDSSDHAFIEIDWMRSYADSTFTVVNCGGHSRRITDVRVLYQASDITYGPKYLQVYVTTASTYYVKVSYQDIGEFGSLSAITPVIENSKSGYSVQGSEVNDLEQYNFGTSGGASFGGGILTPTMWVNYSTGNYDGYNENIRLFPAGNSVSVIAFGASGVTGEPWQSILGYSDRLETRYRGTWETRQYSGYVEGRGSFRAPLFYDSNNTAYYADPASTSVFNDFRCDIMYDKDNTSYYVRPGSTSIFNDARANIWYSRSNTGYYSDPESTSRLYVTNTNYHYRPSHSTGLLVGSYNNIGANSTYTNPIYTIGSSYLPSDSDLSNMYGIGYTHKNAAFDNINGVLDGWGLYVSSAGTARVGLTGETGTIKCTGNITAYASDSRLKENVTPIANALAKVMALRGVTYDWVDECEDLGFIPKIKHETGVIAQEVQAVIPDAVEIAPFNAIATERTGVDNNYLTVDKEKIIPVLIEAIKEQQAQIEELKQTIKTLKEK